MFSFSYGGGILQTRYKSGSFSLINVGSVFPLPAQFFHGTSLPLRTFRTTITAAIPIVLIVLATVFHLTSKF